MEDPLLLVALASLFLCVLMTSLMMIVTGQDRSWISKTLETAGSGYRIRSGPTAPSDQGRVNRPFSGRLSPAIDRLAILARRCTPASALARLGQRLDQAGNPARLTVGLIMEYKGILLVVGGLCGLLVGSVCLGPIGALLVTGCSALAGFHIPDLFILHLAQTRQLAIRRTLPDILETLVVAVEAGLGFEAALAHVARRGRGPMVGEFARVLHEMRLGKPRVEAVRGIAARTTVTELRGFASAVVQASSLGVPLGAVLHQQATEMRIRRRQRAEEQAQKVPVKVLFPMMLCIFPALLVVILGPGLIRASQIMGH
jgi:tight adherence protein C